MWYDIPGYGMLLPDVGFQGLTPALATTAVFNAATKKVAYSGRIYLPDRGAGGTRDIQRVQFRFGAVTKAGGSTVQVSLQDVSLTAGYPIQPDGTPDQSITIANADASFASNTWYRTGALSANRTVTHGDLISIVFEFASFAGADSVIISCINGGLVCFDGMVTTYDGAAWALVSARPNVLLEMADGTFGTITNGFICDGLSQYDIKQDSATQDEVATLLTPSVPMRVDGIWHIPYAAGPEADYNLVVYEGNTAVRTVAVDGNHINTTGPRVYIAPFAPLTLKPGTAYYFAVLPTQTTRAVRIYYATTPDASWWQFSEAGTMLSAVRRIDLGAWTAETLKRFWLGPRVCSFYGPDPFSSPLVR